MRCKDDIKASILAWTRMEYPSGSDGRARGFGGRKGQHAIIKFYIYATLATSKVEVDRSSMFKDSLQTISH